jgi:hypothetical protein
MLSLNKDSWFGLEARAALPTDIKEANQQEVTLGMRFEGRAFLNYDVTRKFLDFQAGLLYATQEASFLGSGGGENVTAPFLGLLMNTSF